MNKTLGFIAALLIASVAGAAPRIAVTIGDGSLQPGTTAGMNISSGTVQHFYSSTATIKNMTNWSMNLTAFGVKADGVTDDSAAINAAITACSAAGATLRVPRGTYLISGELIPKSNCSIEGEGKSASIFKFPQSNINPMNYSMFRTTSALSNFAIRNMGLYGNRAFQTTTFTTGASDGYAIMLEGGPIDQVTFENLFISSFGATGAALNTGGGAILIVPTGANSTVSNVRCINNDFWNNDKASGFYLDSAEGTIGGGRNIWVTGNSFRGGYHNNTIYVFGGWGSDRAKKMFNVTINDNHFYNTEDTDANVEINGTTNFSIDNNKYVYNAPGVAHAALIRSDCENGSFSHNQIMSFSTSTSKPGVALVAYANGEYQDNITIAHNNFFLSTATVDVIKAVKGSRRINILNNVIVSTSTRISRAMSIGEATDVLVQGNQFTNVDNPIVLSEGTFPVTSGIRIKNNTFTGCGVSGGGHIATTGGPISLTYLEVDGNRVISPNSTAGGAAFVISSVTATTGNIFRNNLIYSGLTALSPATSFTYVWNNVGYDSFANSNVARSGPHTMVANTATSISTVTLSAGDYIIGGACGWRTAATTTEFICTLNTTANSIGGGDLFGNFLNGQGTVIQDFSTGIGSAKDWVIPLPASRFSPSSSTSLYLVCQSDQANNCYGHLTAIPIGAH